MAVELTTLALELNTGGLARGEREATASYTRLETRMGATELRAKALERAINQSLALSQSIATTTVRGFEQMTAAAADLNREIEKLAGNYQNAKRAADDFGGAIDKARDSASETIKIDVDAGGAISTISEVLQATAAAVTIQRGLTLRANDIRNGVQQVSLYQVALGALEDGLGKVETAAEQAFKQLDKGANARQITSTLREVQQQIQPTTRVLRQMADVQEAVLRPKTGTDTLVDAVRGRLQAIKVEKNKLKREFDAIDRAVNADFRTPTDDEAQRKQALLARTLELSQERKALLDQRKELQKNTDLLAKMRAQQDAVNQKPIDIKAESATERLARLQREMSGLGAELLRGTSDVGKFNSVLGQTDDRARETTKALNDMGKAAKTAADADPFADIRKQVADAQAVPPPRFRPPSATPDPQAAVDAEVKTRTLGQRFNELKIAATEAGKAVFGSFAEIKSGAQAASVAINAVQSAVRAVEQTKKAIKTLGSDADADKKLNAVLTALRGSSQTVTNLINAGQRLGKTFGSVAGDGQATAKAIDSIAGAYRRMRDAAKEALTVARQPVPVVQPVAPTSPFRDPIADLQGPEFLAEIERRNKKIVELGAEAGDSFADGILRGADDAKHAGSTLGNAVEQGIRDELEQRSPSRVLVRLGKEAAESFALGFGEGKLRIRPITAQDLVAPNLNVQLRQAGARASAIVDAPTSSGALAGAFSVPTTQKLNPTGFIPSAAAQDNAERARIIAEASKSAQELGSRNLTAASAANKLASAQAGVSTQLKAVSAQLPSMRELSKELEKQSTASRLFAQIGEGVSGLGKRIQRRRRDAGVQDADPVNQEEVGYTDNLERQHRIRSAGQAMGKLIDQNRALIASQREVSNAVAQTTAHLGAASSVYGKLQNAVVQATGKLGGAVGLLGRDAGKSFADGITGAVGQVHRSGELTGKAAEEGIRKALDMHSPSRILRRLGREAFDSFADGFNSGRSRLRAITAQDLVRERLNQQLRQQGAAAGAAQPRSPVASAAGRSIDAALGAGTSERARAFFNYIVNGLPLVQRLRGQLAGLGQVGEIAFGNLARSGGGAFALLSNIGEALFSRMRTGTGTLTAAAAAIGAVTAGLLALVAAAAIAIPALIQIGAAGIQINSQLEQTKIGIAAVTASVAELRTSQGVKLEGIDELNAALPLAQKQLEALRVDALTTALEFKDLSQGFLQAVGPGLAAGLSLDQIRKTVVDISQIIIPLTGHAEQLGQELRAILSGDINQDTQVAKALGITRQLVEQAKEQGRLAEFLNEKLKVAAATGKLMANTFAAATSNLKEAGTVLAGTITEGLFNALKDKINATLPKIFEVAGGQVKIAPAFAGAADSLRGIFDEVGKLAAEGLDGLFEAARSLSIFFAENRRQISETVTEAALLARSLGDSVVNLGELFALALKVSGAFKIAALQMQIISFALDVVNGVLDAIFAVVNSIGKLFDLFPESFIRTRSEAEKTKLVLEQAGKIKLGEVEGRGDQVKNLRGQLDSLNALTGQQANLNAEQARFKEISESLAPAQQAIVNAYSTQAEKLEAVKRVLGSTLEAQQAIARQEQAQVIAAIAAQQEQIQVQRKKNDELDKEIVLRDRLLRGGTRGQVTFDPAKNGVESKPVIEDIAEAQAKLTEARKAGGKTLEELNGKQGESVKTLRALLPQLNQTEQALLADVQAGKLSTGAYDALKGALDGFKAGLADATGFVDQQTSAVDRLINSLDRLNQSANSEVEKGIKAIALTAKNEAEAKAKTREALKNNDDFFFAVQNKNRVAANLEAANKVIEPPKKTGGGSRGGTTSDFGANALAESRIKLAEAEAERKLQIEREAIDRLQQAIDLGLNDNLISYREYYRQRAKLTEENAALDIQRQQKIIDEQTKEIERIQGALPAQLGRTKKAGQRDTVNARAEKDINEAKTKILQAETAIAEISAKTRESITADADAERQKLRELEESVHGVREAFLELSGQSFLADISVSTRRANEEIKTLFANGKLIAALQAAQNRDVRNNRSRATGIGEGVDLLRSQADTERLRIQNDVTLGVIGEGEARQKILGLEEKLREAIALRLQFQLLFNKGDEKQTQEIKKQIEALRTLGQDEQTLREKRAASGFLNDKAFVDTAKTEAKDQRLRDKESTAKEIIALDDQIRHSGEDSANRIRAAHLRAYRDIQLEQERAAEEFIANQERLKHSLEVDPSRLNDGVARLLAQQKTLQESLQDFRSNSVQTVFDGIDSAVDKLTEKFGEAGKAVNQLIKDLIKLAATKLFEKLFGIQTGAGSGFGIPQQRQQGGGGGIVGGILNGLGLGGGNAAGSGGGAGGSGLASFATPGFSGGNPAAAILNGGGGQSGGGFGGILSKIPGIGKFFGGGKSLPSLAGPLGPSFGTGPNALPGVGTYNIPGLGTPPIAPSGLPQAGGGLLGGIAGLGASGLLAGGGLLGSLAGGKSPIGQLLGGVGGTLLAGSLGATGIFGGALGAALPALFSNPITAIIGGALIGGALLVNFISGREQRKFRKEVESQYNLKVDGKEKGTALYQSIKALGEEKFGKGKFGKKIIDTIRLEKAKEQLAAYGEATGQQDNPLVRQFRDARELTDIGDPRNQFIRRATGGVVPGADTGRDYVQALLRGGEFVTVPEITRQQGLSRFSALNAGRASIVTHDQRGIRDFLNLLNSGRVPLFSGAMRANFTSALQSRLQSAGTAQAAFVRRASGGLVPGGSFNALPQPQRVNPSSYVEGQAPSSAPEVQRLQEHVAELQRLVISSHARMSKSLDRYDSLPPGVLVTQGLEDNPDAAAQAVNTAFDRRTPATDGIRDKTNNR